MRNLFLILLFSIALLSCTENTRVKKYGGKGTIELPAGQKLVNITWKENHVWYLTRPMTSEDTAATYAFHEESQYGIFKGSFIIKEKK